LIRKLVDHLERPLRVAVLDRGDVGQEIELLAGSVLEPGQDIVGALARYEDDRITTRDRVAENGRAELRLERADRRRDVGHPERV
jgi:hypothetical protein